MISHPSTFSLRQFNSYFSCLYILVALLLVFLRFFPLRCSWISLVRERVILVSVSGVSGTTSLSPGRSGGGISSGVLIWDLWSFRLPLFGSGCEGVAKSLSLSDTAIGAAFPRLDCLGDEPVSKSFNPFKVAFLFTPTDPGVAKLSDDGDSSMGWMRLFFDLLVLRVLLMSTWEVRLEDVLTTGLLPLVLLPPTFDPDLRWPDDRLEWLRVDVRDEGLFDTLFELLEDWVESLPPCKLYINYLNF